MKSIPLLVGVVLLAVLALGWFMFKAEDTQTLLDQPELEVTSESQKPSRSLDPGDLKRSVAKPGDPKALVEEQEQKSSGIEVGADEESVLVRVVDKEGKEPVPGLDVYAFSDDMFLTVQPKAGESAYDLIKRHSQHYRSDALGLVHLRLESGRRGLMAFSDHLLGMTRLQGQEREVELRVHPYPSIEVRVVNLLGQPVVGAQVAARVYFSDQRPSSPRDLNSARTEGPDGLARLAFLNPEGLVPDGKYCVALAGLFETPIEAPIDLEAPPTEVVTLVLPDSGRISIRLEDAEAAAVMDPRAFASIRAPTESKPKSRPSHAADKVSMIPIVEGSGQSDPLALGKEWEVSLMPGPNSRFEAMTQTVVGPQVVGELIEVLFQLPASPTRCVVRGRAIDEEGKPLSKVVLRTMSELRAGAGHSSSGGRVTTEEDGGFEASFDVRVAEGETRWRLIFSTGDREKPDRRFVADFTGRGPGLYDLGDVSLLPDPVLVRGRVVGPDGEGLPEISISLRAPPMESEDELGRISATMNRRAYGKSDSEGHFEVRSDLEGSAFELRALGQGFKFDSIRVSRAEEGVVIRMTALAGLKATFLPWSKDAPIEMFRVIYGLRPEGEPFSGGSGIGREGHISVFMEPGRYDLSLGHGSNWKKVLFEKKGLVLEAGRTLDLGEIQLASPGIEVQLLISAVGLDENSERKRIRGTIRSFEVGGDEPLQENYIGLQEQPHTIYVEKLPTDIEVEMNGFRAQRWTLKQEKQKVKLKPGFEVRLYVRGLAGLPQDAIASLSLHLVKPEDEGRSHIRSGSLTASVDMDCASPEATVILSKPGTYQVTPAVGFRREGGSTTRGVFLKEAIRFQVLDQDSPQSIEINLDPKQVTKALSALSEHH